MILPITIRFGETPLNPLALADDHETLKNRPGITEDKPRSFNKETSKKEPRFIPEANDDSKKKQIRPQHSYKYPRSANDTICPSPITI